MLLNEEPTPEAHPETFSTLDTIFDTEEPNPVHLSLHTLFGTPSAHTFKLQGFIQHTPVTILIDTGSSHNILQPRLAHHLNLCTLPIKPFSIMVGNGKKIHCMHPKPTITVSIQNHCFSISLYFIPIEDADVVLRMDWLRYLGPIQVDFSTPQLFFPSLEHPHNPSWNQQTLGHTRFRHQYLSPPTYQSHNITSFAHLSTGSLTMLQPFPTRYTPRDSKPTPHIPFIFLTSSRFTSPLPPEPSHSFDPKLHPHKYQTLPLSPHP